MFHYFSEKKLVFLYLSRQRLFLFFEQPLFFLPRKQIFRQFYADNSCYYSSSDSGYFHESPQISPVFIFFLRQELFLYFCMQYVFIISPRQNRLFYFCSNPGYVILHHKNSRFLLIIRKRKRYFLIRKLLFSVFYFYQTTTECNHQQILILL